MQPDILLQHPSHGNIILAAKWKRPNGRHAEHYLRQLFAYVQHFGAMQVRLLYPQTQNEMAVEGKFTRPLLTEQGAQAIRGGVSYVRVGQSESRIVDGVITDLDLNTGYLRCSIATEISAWAYLAKAKQEDELARPLVLL